VLKIEVKNESKREQKTQETKEDRQEKKRTGNKRCHSNGGLLSYTILKGLKGHLALV
jgi:hypothetical protein